MHFNRIISALVVSALAAAPAVAGTSDGQSSPRLIMIGYPGGERFACSHPAPQLTVFGHPSGKVAPYVPNGPQSFGLGHFSPQLLIVGHPGPKVFGNSGPVRPTIFVPRPSTGKGRKAKWVAQDGRTFIERLPLPQDPFSDEGLLVPDGTWTDVVLVLEGPVTLVGASEDGRCWAAEVDGGEWTLPLAEPVTGDGETRVYADIELPSWVMEEALDAGGWLDLDHPLHDEVWTAVQDGTLFTP